jgi:DNA-binding transcriptional LysR family regulator
MTSNPLDLNLLFVFEALAEHKSVTRAAEHLGLTQSSTSAALKRLRVALGDPLFVKAGAEMRPTPRATELVGSVRMVLETIKGDILQTHAFDPARTTRTFTILTPDIGEINLIPRLLAHTEAASPASSITTLSMPRHAAAQALESGAVDLAVGYYPDLQKSGLFQQRLFQNALACIVRRDHPSIGTKMTMKQFMNAHHAVVQPEGREHVFEQFLNAKGVQRAVRLRVSHFMSLLPIISTSNLVATVPEDIAIVCAQYGNIRMVNTPMKSPVIEIYQYWHRRNHNDAAHSWLRTVVSGLFAQGGTGSPKRPSVMARRLETGAGRSG